MRTDAEEFPQYWTAVSDTIAFFRRDSSSVIVAVMKNGSERIDPEPWNEHDEETRTRLTKEQAQLLLDNPKAMCSRDRVAKLLEEIVSLSEGDLTWVLCQMVRALNRIIP